MTESSRSARQEDSGNLPGTWDNRVQWSVDGQLLPGEVAGRVTGQFPRTMLGPDRGTLCVYTGRSTSSDLLL